MARPRPADLDPTVISPGGDLGSPGVEGSSLSLPLQGRAFLEGSESLAWKDGGLQAGAG